MTQAAMEKMAKIAFGLGLAQFVFVLILLVQAFTMSACVMP